MEAGAIGGSSERSWRESSGSGLSSNAATECVGAIGAGAGATSDWIEIAGVGGVVSDDGSADGSRRDSEPVLAVDVVTDFAHRPDVDAVPVAVGAAEGATPVGAADADAADVGDVGAADELPGLAGRGGALAAGGGEAAGAGRAGGIVGIADFGTGFAIVAERMAVAEPAGGAAGDAADGAEGRLASADVEDVGFAEVVGRVAEAVGAAELAARVCAAVADPDPDVLPADAGNVDPDAEAILDARAWAGVEPVGVALGFAGAADVRGAVPGDAVCATADFDAEGALAVEADADADAALGVGAAGAAERVGGIGESPDPKSETSSTGEAQVPEYAASEGAAAHEPEVELVAEAPGALEAEEPSDAMERAKAVAPAAEVPSAAGADLELPAFVAASDESGDEALEILVAGLAELANTGPEAFAATAA